MRFFNDYFASDLCEVYLGDALRVLHDNIPDGSVNLIFADPPYNIGKRLHEFEDKWPTVQEYIAWCEKWLDLCISKLTDDGAMYVMASTQSMPYIDLFLSNRMDVLSRIVWHYDSSGVQARRFYGSLYEPILFCVKDKSKYTFNSDEILVEAKTGSKRQLIDYRGSVPKRYSSTKVPGNVWYFPRVRYRMKEYEEHPAQKPEVLLERIIKASSNPGDVVLDPFAGTFTTSAVAKRLKRRSIGIELQEQYVKVGLRRLNIRNEYAQEVLEPMLNRGHSHAVEPQMRLIDA